MITELIIRQERQKQTTLLENQMEESWKLKLHIKMRKVNIIIRKETEVMITMMLLYLLSIFILLKDINVTIKVYLHYGT